MKARKLVSTKGLSRTDWLKHRRSGIGGSDAAAIAGLSRWGNPLSVYLDKISVGEPSEEESRFLEWGNRLEPLIADTFAEKTGLKVRPSNFMWQHHEHKFLLANIDREVIVPDDPLPLLVPHIDPAILAHLVKLGKVGLECKSASAYKSKEWKDNCTPEEYLVQCAHYMMVMDMPYWFLAVLIGGNDFQWRLLHRDLELEQDLFKIEAEFWQMVQSGTAPAIDGTQASDEILKNLYPQASIENTLTLPDDFLVICSELMKLKAEKKTADGAIKSLENKLKEQIGDHLAAVCGDFQLSWGNVSTERFDMDAFKTEQPELYAGYLAESKSRRFSIKLAKKKEE